MQFVHNVIRNKTGSTFFDTDNSTFLNLARGGDENLKSSKLEFFVLKLSHKVLLLLQAQRVLI